jgi:hypothetical protein
MIKNMVTHFRPFANEARNDAELAAAFKKTGERLSARQQELNAEMRKTLTPVKHTISVVALT